MELWCIVLICSLALAALCLLAYLLVLRHSLREAAEELDEKLRTDTNTLISISTGDSSVQLLASKINGQLQALRRERLRLHSGNAELTAAVTNVSHDLRTPLTAICGYLDLLEQEPQTEAAARYLAVLRERTDAMRPDGGAVPLLRPHSHGRRTPHGAGLPERRARAEPCRVLRRALRARHHAIGAVAGRKGHPPAGRRRVFDNILSNAAKYSDGDLTVTLSPDGSVTVSNHASALSRVEAARLFDRFYTVDSARGSTGLGLSIAKLLTEKLHGTISADYENETLRICIAFPTEKQGGT